MTKAQSISFAVGVFYAGYFMFWLLAAWIFVRPYRRKFVISLGGRWIIYDRLEGDILYEKKDMPSKKVRGMLYEIDQMELWRPCLPVSRWIGVALIVEVIALTICADQRYSMHHGSLTPTAAALWTAITVDVGLLAIMIGYYIVAKTETRLAAFSGRLMAGYGALSIGLVFEKTMPEASYWLVIFALCVLGYNLVRTPIGSQQHYT